MKKFILFTALLSAFAISGFAQTGTPAQSTTPPPAATNTSDKPLTEVLSWMMGQWEGEGISRDQQFIGRLNVSPDLDGTIIQITRESMSKNEKVAGGLKEIMLVGLDGTTKKIVETLYDNKNRIGLYVGELGQNEIVFSLATAQPGYVDRRIFRLLPDGGLAFVIEGAAPGKEVSKLVEINFKKKL
jgi:hypothetical protein